jgi:hypothetical protein
MENLVSPLIKPQPNVVIDKPMMDDPYAYVTHMDELTRHDFEFINRKIEQNWITERDAEMLKFVSVHRWMTLAQIGHLFFPEVDRSETIRKRVSRLLKYGLLRRVHWGSYSKPQSNRPSLYELGDSGADILKYKYGMFLGHRDPRHPKPTNQLFRLKYVVTNEMYIRLRESFDLVHFEFHPLLKLKEDQQVPTAKYVLRNPKGRDIPFYLICHREDEKWIKTIRYQAKFFRDYIKASEPEATLVVLVSTDDKAELASKIVEQEGADVCTWFVTDTEIYDSNVNMRKGFFVYRDGQKTYYDLQ